MRWSDGITDLMGMNLGELWEITWDKATRHAAAHGITNSQT